MWRRAPPFAFVESFVPVMIGPCPERTEVPSAEKMSPVRNTISSTPSSSAAAFTPASTPSSCAAGIEAAGQEVPTTMSVSGISDFASAIASLAATYT